FHFTTLKTLFKPPAKPSLKEKHLKSRSAYTLGVASWGFPNLLDATVLRSLALSFLIGFVSLVGIFNIFTLFELWRFIAVTNASAALVARYLLFLLPLLSVELFPATMLIGVLVTSAL